MVHLVNNSKFSMYIKIIDSTINKYLEDHYNGKQSNLENDMKQRINKIKNKNYIKLLAIDIVKRHGYWNFAILYNALSNI